MFFIDGTAVIGIDHGNATLATVNFVCRSSVKESKGKPSFSKHWVKYNNHYYIVGEGHQEFEVDKTLNEAWRILTMVGVAEELIRSGNLPKKNPMGVFEMSVILSVGTPIGWLAEQAREFHDYFMKIPNLRFEYNDLAFCIHIKDCLVSAQGYAGALTDISHMQRTHMIVDIGGKTVDTLLVEKGVPIETSVMTSEKGLNHCFDIVRKHMIQKHKMEFPYTMFERFVMDSRAEIGIPDEIQTTLHKACEEYVDEIFDYIQSIGWNETLMDAYFLGGGASIIERFWKHARKRLQFKTGVQRMAHGYEHIAKVMLKMSDGS